MKFWPFYILILVFGLSCESAEKDPQNDELDYLACDAETLIKDGEELFYTSSDASINLKGGETQSDDFARSGKYSVKVDSGANYAFGATFKEFRKGQFLRFSVWQKKGSDRAYMSVRVKGDDYENQLFGSRYGSTTADGDWVQHNVSILVSDQINEIEVFVTGGGELAYFDDFEYTVQQEIPKNNLIEDINLVLAEDSKNQLKSFISEAKKGPVIKSEQKEYIKGSLLIDGELEKMKIKLKGDWTDHLSSGKPSCRIKMGGNSAYHGLKTFSLHHAKTRNYLDEWVLHKMADREDVLSTTYDFVNVKVNNETFGVYALEEHFDKQLLERRNRREGPIVKYDESGVWALAFMESDSIQMIDLPYYEGAIVNMFKENRTLSNSPLNKNFSEASNLMTLFKSGKGKPSDIFDIDQLAKYYALIGLSGGLHGTTWHNRRFYYNPVTEKLEHILYDAMAFNHGDQYYNSFQNQLYNSGRSKDVSLDLALILDPEFKEVYLRELDRISQVEYLDQFFADRSGELDTIAQAIQNEEPYYFFDKEKYYASAAQIRDNIIGLSNTWDQFIAENKNVDELITGRVYKPRTDSLFIKEISINAYLETSDTGHYRLRVENYHSNDITICGYEQKNWKNHAIAFEQEIGLKGFETEAAEVTIEFTEKPNRLFIKVSNRLDKYYAVKVINWAKPSLATTRMNLVNQAEAIPYKIVGKKAVFSGSIDIAKLIYIPEDLMVEVRPGTTIRFSNGGGLIVSNSFQAIGTKQQSISFLCEDGTSQGLTILNGDYAKFEYVNFKGLSNLNYKNWELTGAITIYETPVTMSFITIDSSLAEDGLNIIRSHVDIKNLKLIGTSSDGFDADFCTGLLSDSYFGNTGNDCIDLSGSIMKIQNVVIESSGDKGISGGERSKLRLENIKISGAITGIASKDNSYVEGINIEIINTSYGLMAFEKKAEYGPASMYLEATSISQTDTIQLIDLGSEISLNGTSVKGTTKVDVEKLYERFSK